MIRKSINLYTFLSHLVYFNKLFIVHLIIQSGVIEVTVVIKIRHKMNRFKNTFGKLKQFFLYYIVVRNFRLILLYDDNVVVKEWTNPNRYYRCLLGGLIWKLIPDLTYYKRRYLIVDF